MNFYEVRAEYELHDPDRLLQRQVPGKVNVVVACTPEVRQRLVGSIRLQGVSIEIQDVRQISIDDIPAGKRNVILVERLVSQYTTKMHTSIRSLGEILMISEDLEKKKRRG